MSRALNCVPPPQCYQRGYATATPQPDDILAFCKSRMYNPSAQGRASL